MDTMCLDCKRDTEVVYDHATGDTVCSECGLVLESHSFDETSEWRTFSDDTNSSDPNRVGAALNPLFETNVLTTEIANPHGTKTTNVINQSILRGISKNKTNDRLANAYERLGAMSERLGLPTKIINRGCLVYKDVFGDEKSACRARNIDAVIGACILVACQQEQNPRTVKEICSVVHDSSKKDIMKAKNLIMRQLVVDVDTVVPSRTIRACDLIKRFCCNMSLGETKVMKAALETATMCDEAVDVRRSPISVAAAVIYVVAQLGDLGKGASELVKEISVATDVAESTIRNTYKDIYPHVRKIVPIWYATEDKIKFLSAP